MTDHHTHKEKGNRLVREIVEQRKPRATAVASFKLEVAFINRKINMY